jgi:hydrogenase nickel incorporation protein HypA/HybF
VIGALSSIVDDSVQFYWDIICKDTLAEGAVLHFRRLSVELECRDCNGKYQPAGEDLACPACGSINIRVLQGKEFYVEAIEIETESQGAAP